MDRIEYCHMERAKGRKYQSIADELGVSRQRVHQICKRPPREFVKEHQCIYSGLRAALNDGRINITKLAVICDCSRFQVSRALEGKTKRISKSMIDKLIGLTGMTYEELFLMRNYLKRRIIAMGKKVNPRRRPATQADVEKAKKLAQNRAVTWAWAIIFSALRDKEGFGKKRLQRVWDEVNSISESITKGYININDLIHTLDVEAGIVLE